MLSLKYILRYSNYDVFYFFSHFDYNVYIIQSKPNEFGNKSVSHQRDGVLRGT